MLLESVSQADSGVRIYVCMFACLNIYMIMTHKYGILFIPLVIDGELVMVVV